MQKNDLKACTNINGLHAKKDIHHCLVGIIRIVCALKREHIRGPVNSIVHVFLIRISDVLWQLRVYVFELNVSLASQYFELLYG